LLCAAAAAGLVVLAYRGRVAGIHRRYQAVLDERARIGREIHDTLMQGVTGISLQLEVASQKVIESPRDGKNQIDRALGRLDEVLSEARRCILELRASPFEKQPGLVQSIRQLADELAGSRGIAAKVDVQGEPRTLAAPLERELLLIAREAVTNAALHSRASHLDLTLAFERGRVRFEARDDGRGFDAGNLDNAHFGIVGMRERARQLGGELAVRTSPGAGTEVVVTAPAQ
jgi:signal transduction histidine kinase